MIELENISNQWDVVVVGGGPAGSAAAITAAKDGLRVLQVDAKPFPRRKVCGGCLNQVSVGLLKSLVGEDSPIFDDAPELNRFRLMDRRRQFEFETPTGLVVERSKLDNYLVEIGKQNGVTFLSPVTATLGEATSAERLVDLKRWLDRKNGSSKSCRVSDWVRATTWSCRNASASPTSKLTGRRRSAGGLLSEIVRERNDLHVDWTRWLCRTDQSFRFKNAHRRSGRSRFTARPWAASRRAADPRRDRTSQSVRWFKRRNFLAWHAGADNLCETTGSRTRVVGGRRGELCGTVYRRGNSLGVEVRNRSGGVFEGSGDELG